MGASFPGNKYFWGKGGYWVNTTWGEKSRLLPGLQQWSLAPWVSRSDARERYPRLDRGLAVSPLCLFTWGIARCSLSYAFNVPGQGWASGTFHLPQTHASISPVPPYSREQPIFTTRAHVFQIDPSTKKNWVPASKQAVTVSYFYDSTRNSYRIISVDGAKVGGWWYPGMFTVRRGSWLSAPAEDRR